ncbi:class I adenylate-forming enzyme family protein [Solirubrobacter soli]|uniref:class I adenylate-forming enzyme family protein n=1 Tax=Solirubrobacter soli TaxID=363832 RepID=UPI000421C825|nr:class I adenylate-forming enzyme family protein [Solirubrobacter soli]
METLAGLLAAHAGEERVAISYPDARLTYAQLDADARRVAGALRANGVGPGARVGIFMPNALDYIRLIFAVSYVGAQLVPINARFKRRELAHVIANSELAMLFTAPAIPEVDFPAIVADAVGDLGTRVVVAPLDDFTAEPVSEPVGSADDVGLVLYTSGTAASPKGCELTWRAVINAWRSYADGIGLQADTPLWAPCPLFHVGGIGPLTSVVLRGSTMVSAPHFVAAEALEQIVSSRAVHLFPAFPAFTLGILRTPAYTPERLSQVRTVLNVAPPETQELIQSLLPAGAVLLNDFGMTEAAGIVTFTPVGDSVADRCRTNGLPFEGVELRIEDGEIQFRGANAFRSYLNEPAATAATIIEGGWVRTGDTGRLTDSGRLVYVGRIKEILKVGGENVAPAEVEAWLSTHPAVAVAQIVGKPDDKYGEVPVAFIELLPGKQASGEELIAFCRGQLANFKIPREVRFVTEWPMSATKIQKFRLRELV